MHMQAKDQTCNDVERWDVFMAKVEKREEGTLADDWYPCSP